MKKTALIFFILLCTLGNIAAQTSTKGKQLFNWGIRAGVNAPFIDIRQCSVDGKKFDDPSVNTKVGLFGSLFSRINFKKHYLQLEVGTHYTRYQIELEPGTLSGNTTDIYSPATEVTNRFYGLDIPLVYGYNFVKQGPYELSFFAGPKIKYFYKTRESVSSSEQDYTIDMKESIRPVTANFVLGLGTSISRFSIDFRYEFGITNLTRQVPYTLYKGDSVIKQGNILIERAMNLLSFSVGVIL